uniref:Uncharacterized protein n=1 Tax=Anguilla anguilla TaxID=7936 RepID=A0A0E9SYZ9_ANGAN
MSKFSNLSMLACRPRRALQLKPRTHFIKKFTLLDSYLTGALPM